MAEAAPAPTASNRPVKYSHFYCIEWQYKFVCSSDKLLVLSMLTSHCDLVTASL
jgi:hypothetical protein